MSAADWKLLLADSILVVHFGIVAFIILGLPLIWTGYFCQWAFVRNLWFRVTHLALMSLVALQALLGIICPLTTWENRLRASAGSSPTYETTFIDHWLSRLLFFEFSPVIFTIAYTLFFLLIAATWIVIPPVRRNLVKPDSGT